MIREMERFEILRTIKKKITGQLINYGDDRED